MQCFLEKSCKNFHLFSASYTNFNLSSFELKLNVILLLQEIDFGSKVFTVEYINVFIQIHIFKLVATTCVKEEWSSYQTAMRTMPPDF